MRLVSGTRLNSSHLDELECTSGPHGLNTPERAAIQHAHGGLSESPHCRLWHPANLLLDNPWRRPTPPELVDRYRPPDVYVPGGDGSFGQWTRYQQPQQPGCGRSEVEEINGAMVSQPALTRVCRRIREETLPVFYGAHRFVLPLGLYETVADENPKEGPQLEGYMAQRKYIHPPVEALVPAHVALIKHLGIVYIERVQLRFVKESLLPAQMLRRQNVPFDTFRLAATYHNTFRYHKCSCICCCLVEVRRWELLPADALHDVEVQAHWKAELIVARYQERTPRRRQYFKLARLRYWVRWDSGAMTVVRHSDLIGKADELVRKWHDPYEMPRENYEGKHYHY